MCTIKNCGFQVVPERTKRDHENWVATWAYNMAWLAELPAAYSALGLNNTDPEPGNCTTQHWEEPTPIDSYYHPGAAFEMRSIQTPHGHGHQACYDNEGNLIRTGVSAGTADNRHYSNYIEPSHVSEDVLPFVRAAQLDGNPVWVNNLVPTNLNRPMMHNGSHLQQYLNLRPPIPNSKPLLPPGTSGPQ